jgi:hypothetical protein
MRSVIVVQAAIPGEWLVGMDAGNGRYAIAANKLDGRCR